MQDISDPPSAKVRGKKPPTTMAAEVGDFLDACDDMFMWYPSRVMQLSDKHNSALVKFGEFPDKYNTWIPLGYGRLAPLNTFTEGLPTDNRTRGTTADIAVGTRVEVRQAAPILTL